MTLSTRQLRDRLQDALDFGGGQHTIEQLIERTMSRDMQCLHNDQAVVFTQVEPRGETKILNVYLAAGDLDAVLALQPQIFDLARAEGCSSVMCNARQGWGKVLPAHGWSLKFVTWEHAL